MIKKNPDGQPSIEALYTEFEAAHAIFFRLDREYDAAGARADSFDSAWHKRFERSTSTCNKLAMRIARAPATTLREISLKLRIVAWMESDASYDTLEDLDHWRARQQPSLDAEWGLHILAELQEDLHRVAAQC